MELALKVLADALTRFISKCEFKLFTIFIFILFKII